MAWAPDYVTSAELKAFLRIGDTDDDAQVSIAISAASRAIDRCAGRQFGKVATTEVRAYTAQYDRHRQQWIVDIDDLADIVTVTVLVGSDELVGYTFEPFNAVAVGGVYTRLVLDSGGTGASFGVTIDAAWGWPSVPTSVKQATLLQASRFMARRDSPYGIAGSPTEGSEVRLLARVDPDVGVALQPYRRNWWAA